MRVIRAMHGREVLLRYYYVLDGIVYEAPTLASIMRTRMLKIAWHLHEAWKSLHPSDEEVRAAEAASDEQKDSEQEGDAEATNNKRKREDQDDFDDQCVFQLMDRADGRVLGQVGEGSFVDRGTDRKALQKLNAL